MTDTNTNETEKSEQGPSNTSTEIAGETTELRTNELVHEILVEFKLTARFDQGTERWIGKVGRRCLPNPYVESQSNNNGSNPSSLPPGRK